MGCCCSCLGPNVHYCKECNLNVIESYPTTRCSKCDQLLFTTQKEPVHFAMPQRVAYISLLHGVIYKL